jgi:hypothetical protein
MLPQLVNMLSWWQWLIMAAIPPAIVALYFLKLRRRPIEVPSTYLWLKSIEDLHVNTIWQRLRRNLLLFLQLLLVLLAMLAVLRPGWRGQELPGDRFIYLIDNSASMQATDAEPSRLAEAKRRAVESIDKMESGDVGMVVSFADSARVEQMFTEDRRLLRRVVEQIQPTERSTALAEALKVASGLANPGRTAYEATDVQVAEALPATVFIFSDGKFDDARDFNLGNLTPVFTPIGTPETSNVAIVAFSVRRHETRPAELQAFARLQNFGSEEVHLSMELEMDADGSGTQFKSQLIDADETTIAAGEARGVAFDIGAVETGVLTLRIASGDRFGLDDKAWAVINRPDRAKVLLVTPGNEPLETALATKASADIADVVIESTSFLEKEKYQQDVSLGAYDLVIYDRCAPKEMPQANTLFIAALPPVGNWKSQAAVVSPMIIDVDPSHPITQFLEMGDVVIAEGTPLAAPPASDVLIDSHAGPMMAIAPREAFEDAVLGFYLVAEQAEAGQAKRVVGTNWPIRASFPAFVYNMLDYLGGGRRTTDETAIRPGRPVELSSPQAGQALAVRKPSGETVRLGESPSGRISFTATDRLGVYEVVAGETTRERFAVNLFDMPESNVAANTAIEVGFRAVERSAAAAEAKRRELWRPILVLALVVLGVEWYVYNRRVYM